MRSVAESPKAMDAVEDACESWLRARNAWDTIVWVISHDPTKGVPLSEGGNIRSLVFHGSWAHEMPTIYVEYEITDDRILINEAFFRDATTTAGSA